MCPCWWEKCSTGAFHAWPSSPAVFFPTKKQGMYEPSAVVGETDTPTAPGGASRFSSRGPSTWGSWRTWWNTASLWRRPFSPGFTGRRSLRFSSTRWPSNRAAEVV